MKKVGIICGGFSSEREISMKSSKTILDAISKRFNAKRLIVEIDGWYVEDGGKKPFDLNTLTYDESNFFDFFIIYLHGDPGENGKISSFLDIKGAKYVNSSSLVSALSFDKWYCNQFLNNFGFKVAKSIFLSKNKKIETDEIITKLGLPVIVKPTDSGSSFGVFKVNHQSELDNAVLEAFKEGSSVVIEEFLKGREITCGVYRLNDKTYTLPLAEIISENEILDYDAKYNGKSTDVIPAKINDDISDRIHKITKSVYDLIGLNFIARIDFIVVNDEPYVMEINTTPGFSPASIYPLMIQNNGTTIDEFLCELIEYEISKKMVI